jgi:hypothetical protein
VALVSTLSTATFLRLISSIHDGCGVEEFADLRSVSGEIQDSTSRL